MTGITKDELMHIAEKTGSTSYRNRADTANPAFGFSAVQLAQFANSILDRAAVELDGAWHTEEAAEYIRALKINTGD